MVQNVLSYFNICTIITFVNVFKDVLDTFDCAANFYIHVTIKFHEKVGIVRSHPGVIYQMTT